MRCFGILPLVWVFVLLVLAVDCLVLVELFAGCLFVCWIVLGLSCLGDFSLVCL